MKEFVSVGGLVRLTGMILVTVLLTGFHTIGSISGGIWDDMTVEQFFEEVKADRPA